MSIPALSTFTSAVKNGELKITASLLPHPAFKRLLSLIKADHLLFKSVVITKEDKTNHIAIDGQSVLMGNNLGKAYVYLFSFTSASEKYGFEWHGWLSTISIQSLVNSGIMSLLPANVVSGLTGYAFKNVDFTYTSINEVIGFEVTSSDLSLPLASTGLSLEHVRFFYEHSLSGKTPPAFSLDATVKFGSTKVRTEIELPAGSNGPRCWVMKLKGLTPVNNLLSDITTFLSGNSATKKLLDDGLLKSLPEKIKSIPHFELTEFDLQLSPTLPALHSINLSMQSREGFELFKGFSIRNAGFNIFYSLPPGNSFSSLSVFGTFRFDNVASLGMSIIIPLSAGRDWTIEMNGAAELQKLESIEALGFLKISDLNFPAEWLQVSNITLERLRFTFSLSKTKVVSAQFALAFNAKSELIPGISVKNPYLEFNLTF